MTREKNLHVLDTDKCFPKSFDPLWVKPVPRELWVEGPMEIRLGDELGNTGGELERERPREEAWYQASSCCGVGTAKACVPGDAEQPYRTHPRKPPREG